MKKIFVILLLLASVTIAHSQCLPLTKVVIPSDTASASQLYQRSRMFFVNEYQSAKAVISFEDSTLHTIVGTGVINIKPSVGVSSAKLFHTVRIECRDGRYRYTISGLKVEMEIGFQHLDYPYQFWVDKYNSCKKPKQKAELRRRWIEPMNTFINSLTTAMNLSSAEDW